MATMKLSPGKNIRIFKSPFLEQFTYVHPIMPIALWGPLVVYWFTTGLSNRQLTLGFSAGVALSGLFIWTLAEYLLHRFVFHFEATTPFQKRVAFLIHGVHHDDPNDARRLLMPPAAAIFLAVIFYALFALVLGSVLVKPFFAGFIVGYLWYDYTHFATHWVRPRGRWMKALKTNHMRHHFITHDKRYGVSNTLWDHVFRTREQERTPRGQH